MICLVVLPQDVFVFKISLYVNIVSNYFLCIIKCQNS